jgi:galactokinase/mevalonate kinase-like predicted kinase
MRVVEQPLRILLSLPPKMARELASVEPDLPANCFGSSDPPDCRLGSGGGTAHLLVEAWRAAASGTSLTSWLRQSRQLVIHGGGQSRRLPAYAAVSKPLIPMTVLRWSLGQRLRQNLLDLQLPFYRKLFSKASARAMVMMANGDVLLRCEGELSVLPDADIVAIGLWVRSEQAARHGVFFCPRNQPDKLAFFLQKPSLSRIRELSSSHMCLVDSGVWLLSERAVQVLLRKCGWEEEHQQFAGGRPQPYELYARMGLALGSQPTESDAEINALEAAVLPLPQGQFYHFGTSRDLVMSVSALQNLVLDQTKSGLPHSKPHSDQHTHNAICKCALDSHNHTLWVENSFIPASWQLASEHILTGIPENSWTVKLERGVCVDFAPVEENMFCVRMYGIDDPFRGAIGDDHTMWLGRRASEWFASRGINWQEAKIDPSADLQLAPLFPVVGLDEIDSSWLQWLFASAPERNKEHARRWVSAVRVSAQEICERIDLKRLYEQRARYLQQVLLPLAKNHRLSVFYRLDLESTARLYAATPIELPPVLPLENDADPMKPVHDRMFRAAVQRLRGATDWERYEADAFALLRELILREIELQPVSASRHVLDDQIIWGRSPVRLDLAGGWTDTPPFCLQHGGEVVNLAVNLNGQPPIQVFARISEKPELVIRSIDLGVEERVRTYEELQGYAQVGSGFAVAKAAFALAGFLPRFQPAGKHHSLKARLDEFGGGIEVAMLCAVPKGSGLGTSSILAVTLLGTLSELCGLNWSNHDLMRRTLALEQMLTTGGGWQDQAGGLLRGFKLIETEPGLAQKPIVRWLPGHFFSREYTDTTVLLYYTGLARTAKEILKEIVRGMFLNSGSHLEILDDIGQNAMFLADAVQRNDWEALCEAVRRSWILNQRLDKGTNPPAVQWILDQIDDHLAAAKLLGAGGGGYLLMFAKDDEAARHIRRTLTTNPPNTNARFVALDLSETGFQVTRS